MVIDSDSDDDGVNVTIKSASVDGKCNPSLNESMDKPKWRKHITKGQKIRMKNLLESGLSREEARRQVFSKDVLETPNALKRSRDGEQGSSGEKQIAKRTKPLLSPKKRAGLTNSYQATSRKEADQGKEKVEGSGNVQELPKNPKTVSGSGGRSYRDVASVVRVGIVMKGFPSIQMSHMQLDAVQDALLLKIEEQRHAEIKPKFTKCSYKQGYLICDCKDQATATWLKEVTRSLTLWENVELLALDEKEIPPPEMFHAFFPLSADFSDERIKGLIESQNDGLTTEGWRILNRSNPNKHAEWTLNMDDKSIKILSKRNFVLNFRFGETQLRKIKTSGQRVIENKTKDNNPAQNKDKKQTSVSVAATTEAKTVASANNKRSPKGLNDGSIAPPKKHQGATDDSK